MRAFQSRAEGLSDQALRAGVPAQLVRQRGGKNKRIPPYSIFGGWDLAAEGGGLLGSLDSCSSFSLQLGSALLCLGSGPKE